MSDYYHNIEEELSFGMARTDRVLKHVRHQRDRIEELEAQNKRLNEQMDAIEEMGTESLNALPDCLMRLAPALVENDELKAKLAKAVEALEWVKFGGGPNGESYHELACQVLAAVAEPDKLNKERSDEKGQDDE